MITHFAPVYPTGRSLFKKHKKETCYPVNRRIIAISGLWSVSASERVILKRPTGTRSNLKDMLILLLYIYKKI